MNGRQQRIFMNPEEEISLPKEASVIHSNFINLASSSITLCSFIEKVLISKSAE
uniref:Uncharacterized protein n=1 Tax=Heterorhabditis bacteriophora TaxID=37862 RepID=A0A1I7X0S4_HETBA